MREFTLFRVSLMREFTVVSPVQFLPNKQNSNRPRLGLRAAASQLSVPPNVLKSTAWSGYSDLVFSGRSGFTDLKRHNQPP